MRGKRPIPRAIIIGGSMSGLFGAAFLRQIGWLVDVYERSPVELVGCGAGITTHPELRAAPRTAAQGVAHERARLQATRSRDHGGGARKNAAPARRRT